MKKSLKEESKIKKSIGRALQNLRMRSELSIEQVSSKIGAKPEELTAWEDGSRTLPAPILFEILSAINARSEEFESELERIEKVRKGDSGALPDREDRLDRIEERIARLTRQVEEIILKGDTK